MFGNVFYHQTMRKMVAVFGTLFNDISVVRRNSLNQEIKRMKVPLAYGPKERFLARLEKQDDFNKGQTIELPRLAFQITNITYDGTRKLNTMHRNVQAIDDVSDLVKRQYNPVAYKLTMELYVLAKYIDDANQIVEQILPWFTPDYTVTVKSIPELQLIDDVPVTLQSVNMSDNYEDDWLSRRDIVWTLTFEVKTLFYGPIKPRPIITSTQVDFLVPGAGQSVDDSQAQAQTARISRASVFPLTGSNIDEIFGYDDNIESFTDSKKYDPVSGTDQDIVLKIVPEGIISKEKLGSIKIIST